MKVVMRIISVVIFLILIVRLIWPSIFTLFNKVDIVTIILLLSAIIAFYSIDAYKFLKKQTINSIVHIIIPLTCISLVIIRFKYPNLKFDNITFNLILIAVIVLIIPDIKDLLLRIRKIKKGDFEAEFGEMISDLADRTSEAEESIEDKNDITPADISDEFLKRFSAAAADPRGAFLVLSIEIESRIRELVHKLNIPEVKKTMSLNKILDVLGEQEFIEKKLINATRRFWSIRNDIIHDNYNTSSGTIYRLIDIGLDILRLLPKYIGNVQQE